MKTRSVSQTPPGSRKVHDTGRHIAHLERAYRRNAQDRAFLARHAIDELISRLEATVRTFTQPALLFTHDDGSQNALLGHFGAAPLTILPASLCEFGELDDHGSLPLAAESIDLAVSVFGLQRVNRLQAVISGIRQALCPDGLFMAVMPGEGTLHELRQAMIETETELAGGAAMRIDRFISTREAGALLQSAGFSLPVSDQETLTLRYEDTNALIDELRDMGATSCLAGSLRPLPRGFRSRLEANYRKRFADPDGRVRATVNLVYMTGWAPHSSQQKPLRPGSGEVSLADALRGRPKV